MKKGIHPEYQEATVKCVCGNEFKTRSTLKEISVEICAACHPFFTGQQKLVDSAGRVERFMRKYGKDYAVEEAPVEKEAVPTPEAPAAQPEAEKASAEPNADKPPAEPAKAEPIKDAASKPAAEAPAGEPKDAAEADARSSE